MNKRIFFLCYMLVAINGYLFGQRTISESTEAGMLHLLTQRPILEVKLVDMGETTNILFERATTYLDFMVVNNGNSVAEQCWLSIRAEPRSLIIYDDQLNSFNIFPGDTIYKRVKVEVRENISNETVRVIIDVEENSGFNMYPSRIVNFFIEDKPDFDIAVVDVATIDQNRIGYFDVFQNVDLFFRLQNCGNVPFDDVSVNFQTLGRTNIVSGNPNRVVGRMEVGETRDIQIQINTGMGAENVSIRLNINADDSSFSEEFRFEFLADYKPPQDMIDDGCEDYMPTISANLSDQLDFELLPSKPENDNRIAIIVANQNYFSLDPLDYALPDAEHVYDLFHRHMGYSRQNIFYFPNLLHNQFVDLFELNGVDFNMLRRRITRGREQRDVTIFYVGYGAADLVNGEIYLLPIDYIKYGFHNKYPLSKAFEQLKEIKESNPIVNITSILNIRYVEWSNTGNNNELNFKIREFHNEEPGFSTFVSSPVFQQSQLMVDDKSLFTEVFVQGLEGLADFYDDGMITALLLMRLLQDEIIGVPGRTWLNNQFFQVPLFFGEDRVMY